MSETPTPEPAAPEVRPAVLLDAGKCKKKVLKALERGRGPLLAEVDAVIDEVRRELGPAGEGRELLPLILICRRKPRRRLL